MADTDKLAKLREIRNRKDIQLRPTKYLRETVKGLDGTEKPLTLRYYQVQMIMNLLAMPRFVVGDDTGLGKCVSLKGSLILTNRGILRADDIENWEGMTPDTFKPLSRPLSVMVNGEARNVRSFYYGGKKPTIKIRTRYGLEVEGTQVHPLMVRRDGKDVWIKMSDIRVGDHASIERKLAPFPTVEPELPMVDVQDLETWTRKFEVPTHLNPDLSRLLGYIVAEGWTNHRYSFTVTQCPVLNPDIRQNIKELIRSQLCYSVLENDRPTMVVNSVFLRDYLKNIGIPDALSATKAVPWCVLQGTEESVREFLRGYFEGEGSVGAGIEISSASEELLHQVQLLLLRFGIVGRCSPKRVKGREHTYWRLTIFGDDARLFRDHIGFVSDRKTQALSEALAKKSNTNHDVVPDAQVIVEALRAEIYSRAGRLGHKGAGIVKRWGSAFFNTLSHVRAGRRDPSYSFLRRMLEVAEEVGASNTPAYAAVKAVVDRNFFYDRVVSIEAGEDDVFDLEVDSEEHCFVGNGFVCHNTIECISSLCYLWDKYPEIKALVLTKKSALRQWADEFGKFTEGVHVVTCRGTAAQRKAALEEFDATPGPVVLVMGHRSAVQDFTSLQGRIWDALIIDEVTVAKNPKSQMHQVCQYLSAQSKRSWGLTATLIKNNLLEGYGIMRVVDPTVFQMSESSFIDEYCVTELVNVGRGRKIKQVVGYRRSGVNQFRDKIEMVYLGRPKHAVASELPVLTSKTIKVGMSDVQKAKYQEALSGILQMGDGEEKETTKLTQVTYCQEIANHPKLIGVEGTSEKLDTLVDMLTDGDLEGEKVIVFTKYEKMVGLGVEALEAKGVKCVRITGKEDEDGRKAAQDQFQDFESPVKVVWITTAGSDAINLQAASAIVFYDLPFSAGDFLQCLGRMIRIGSVHSRVFAINLIADRTVDERVNELLTRKMVLLEAVLGKRIKDEDLTDDVILDGDSMVEELFQSLKEAAQEYIDAR